MSNTRPQSPHRLGSDRVLEHTALSIKFSYAKALYERKQLEDAETVLMEILRTDVKMVCAYELLGEVEKSRGHFLRAELAIEEWLSIEPGNAAAWYQLGVIDQGLGNLEKAMRAYRRAAELAPAEISHWTGYAISALLATRLTDAQIARDQLIQKFPKHALTYLVDGHIQKMVGDMHAAIDAYESAFKRNAHLASAIYNLVDLRTPALDDALTKHIETLLQRENIACTDKANLNFALALIYEKAERYDEAFAHYKHANAATLEEMSSRGVSYDPRHTEGRIDKTILTYPAARFHHPIESLSIDVQLIFIVGVPRSGTTLIERILGSHAQVAIGGELPIVQAAHNCYVSRRKKTKMDDYADVVNKDEHDLLLETREFFLERLFEHDLEGDYVTNKLPANFEMLGFIRLLFPQAVIIHNRRDLMATCWSLYSSNFGVHEPYYNSMAHLAHYCRMYQRLMKHWVEVLDPAMIEVCYEDMVTRPADEIRRLLANVGLAWDDNCLTFYENSEPVLTASYNQVRRPMYRSSIDRWRNYEPYLNELLKSIYREGEREQI